MILELENIHKSFTEPGGVRTVLDGLNLVIDHPGFIGIKGPSGSGKSTLLNIVAAIESPDQGLVRVLGEQVTALGEPHRTLFRRKQIGFVYQFANLVPTLTVGENLQLPLKLNGIHQTDQVETMLESLGLGDRVGSFPDVLSGGEQQRVSIARAMIHRPALILADEPTGNLDEKNGDAVLSLLRTAVENGSTVLMVTHSERAVHAVDKSLTLKHGRF